MSVLVLRHVASAPSGGLLALNAAVDLSRRDHLLNSKDRGATVSPLVELYGVVHSPEDDSQRIG